jgi:hypothetical protein
MQFYDAVKLLLLLLKTVRRLWEREVYLVLAWVSGVCKITGDGKVSFRFPAKGREMRSHLAPFSLQTYPWQPPRLGVPA